ncbi:MAG: PspC domain-containing protein [Bacteroidetes bacterium]|nr:PspC domain-containing protein [Bacteroidota bacterium]
MKKILQINLSGRAISIEEPAYEKLQQYLAGLRSYFAKEESLDEILNDIEGRISELLHEKLQRGTDRITEKELEEVIASIGRPEDFEGVSEENTTPASSGAPYRQKRLYRDAEDKVLGGVCSGVASYLGIDPTIVRLLFAIVTFGGFGTGFLIYVALWILLPKRSLRGLSARRLYRNPDDRVLGGVASGLAEYFNTPARNVRLIFAAPILLNMLLGILDVLNNSLFIDLGVGAFTSTFVLAYIILWVILPEAQTYYQKMEMRGEKVDLDRIKQTVKESAERLEQRMKTWGSEVEESARNLSERAKEFSHTGRKRFGILNAIGSVIRFFLYLFLGTVVFAFLVAGVAILFAGLVTWPAQQFIWSDVSQQWGFWIMIFFFFFIPSLFGLIFIIRRLFRIRRPAPVLRWSFGILWTIGWIALFWIAAILFRDFQYKERLSTEVVLPRANATTLLLDQTTPPFEYSGTWQWIQGDPSGFDVTRDSLKIPAVGFRVELSPDSVYHARLLKYAWGRTSDEARARLSKIDYMVQAYDSVIDLQPGFGVGIADTYCGQHVVLTLLVPRGKSVQFSKRVLDDHRWLAMRDVAESGRPNTEDGVFEAALDRFRPGVLYTMGADGELYRPDGMRAR